MQNVEVTLGTTSDGTTPAAYLAGHKKIGSYLLEAGLLTSDALSEALLFAQETGIRLGRALVLQRNVNETELMGFLAEQHNLPYINLSLEMVDAEVAHRISAHDTRVWGALPIMADETGVTVVITDPLEISSTQQVEAILEQPVKVVVTTEQAFEQALEALYHEEYTHLSTQQLRTLHPRESAFEVISHEQKIILALLLFLSVIACIFNVLNYLILVNALTTIFYLAFSTHRFYLIYRALSTSLEVPVSAEEIAALDDRSLPIYTILIPLYKEADVLPKLTHSIASLDYPKAKLDVKLLMEANDAETIAAAQALDLPLNFEQVIIPHSMPKTKPKACNYGLIKARGELVVIYDAEDLPDPDQLKKAVIAFTKAGDSVVCVQAKLNYFNRDQNLLTRWFTLEYSMWFDLFLPGLNATDTPLPLGGTSNHFRRSRLEELGAWDPFNVTEDADLGVRLYKAGYKTLVIDSTTYEEANSDVKNWIRQRSRWMKGYIQTWLVHMRHPFALRKAIGTKAFLSFNLTIGGTFLGALLNPIYWCLTAIWFLVHWGLLRQVFPVPIYYTGMFNLFVGNFAFLYVSLAGCMRRDFDSMVKYSLLIPLYWILMSIATWKGFIQLLYKPFYWEKTVHGLAKNAPHTAASGTGSNS